MTCRRLHIHAETILLALLALAWGPSALDAQDRAPWPTSDETVEHPAHDLALSGSTLTEEQRTLHLLNRATFGPTPADLEAVRDLGIAAWLDEQLEPASPADALERELAERYPSLYQSGGELYEAGPSPTELQAMRVRLQDSTSTLSETERQELRRELAQNGPGRILGEMTAAKFTRAVVSERQLEEVMVDFWFDHFNVFWGKGADRWLVADYERSAIRPHVFGTFEDLLVATATHPAMLFYLDNWRSMAPDTAGIRGRVAQARSMQSRMSRQGRSRSAQGRASSQRQIPDMAELEDRLSRLPGLNENYAREILELHTLGVDGGYTQDDVLAVARALTGWSMQMPGNRQQGGNPGRRPAMAESPDGVYGFVYRDQMHDKQPKVILGHRFQGGGQEEGRAVLAMLANHPSTARHIATQMATRFAADDPPEALVAELEQVFLDTGGDLREVTRALFLSEHMYAPENYGGRIKSPVILVASALRATEAEVVNPRALIETLRSLEQAPYLAEAPTGYEEASAGWVSGGAMLNRMNFGIALASGEVRGVRVDGEALFARAEAAAPTPLEGLGLTVLPGVEIDGLVSVIQADFDEDPPGSARAAGIRALGMMLGSPEFQSH